MTQDQTRQIGRALMALSVVQVLLFLIGATRRSYLVIAVPVGAALGLVGGLGFWVGYTMAYTNWDDPADYPPVTHAPPVPPVEPSGASPAASSESPTA